MKKLFKISPLIFASIVPVAMVACQKEENKSEVKKIEIKKTDPFENNQYIKKLVSTYISADSNLSDQYIANQNNTLDAKYNELKYAMNFFPPYYINAENHASDFLNLVIKSKKIIVDTLLQDWYWYLKNIDKSTYLFNPYGDSYSDDDDTEALVNSVKQKFPSLILKTNSNIKNLIELDWQQVPETRQYNKFSNHKVLYLVFDNNVVMKAFSYTQDNTQKFVLMPDLLYIDKPITNNPELLQALKAIEDEFYNQRVLEIKKAIDYNKAVDGDDYDVNESYKFYNDEQLSKLFNTEAYAQLIQNTVEALFAKNEKVYRFTWRSINE
ncbi:aromatic motif membrane protein [Metamycoplasma neophronis]|nr:aromatic motif membrane protein [Metamycoplasma neophronis]